MIFTFSLLRHFPPYCFNPSITSVTTNQPRMDNHHIFSEFEDPVRQFLIAQIAKNEPGLEMPRPNCYALWFADIEALVKWSSDDKEAMYFRGIFLTLEIPSFNVPNVWVDEEQTNPRDENMTVDDQGHDHTEFSSQTTKIISDEARARDHNMCLLTAHGKSTIKSVHIIPSSLNGQVSGQLHYTTAWAELKLFWGKDKMQEWRNLLEEGYLIDTEKVYNLMTLDAQVKDYWEKGLIAFRPIRVNRDQTEIQIAFHWLPYKGSLGDIEQIDIVPIEDPPFRGPGYRPSEGEQREDGSHVIIHAETGKKICSGHVFTVRTDDKEHRPLPSFELLELRWHLSRIAVMGGYPMPRIVEYWGDTDSD